ncbi:adenosine deaminase [uncultured Amnibacterium sp.]|uniref:adenosine deaminase n=1 Tax=uncultured Amnibacterium sp. TaxID=1631851 RepID=UPI0035C96706
MLDVDDYLRLLPKTELHCHLVSTMTAGMLVAQAEKHGVPLRTTDPARLFDYRDLQDFLVAFEAAHQVLRTPEELAQVAYDGVRIAAEDGALRYREYFVNPQSFAEVGLGYRPLMEGVIEGLSRAQADFGIGFGIVVAIRKDVTPAQAVELVRLVGDTPLPEVVGIGADYLTAEGTEDPARFADAYRLAKRLGLKTTIHAGETPNASPDDVRAALDVLGVDRIDHGYRVVDDPQLLARVVDEQIPFDCTPISTTICSGWRLDPQHRIARMIEAGVNVNISTDDALFFRTDLGREYREGLVALGVDAPTARRLALNGIDAAFCSDDEKAALRARFAGELLTLDAMLA